MGMLPRIVSMTLKKKGETKGPCKSIYEADTTEEIDLTKQAAAPDPGDPIEIGNDNNKNDLDD